MLPLVGTLSRLQKHEMQDGERITAVLTQAGWHAVSGCVEEGDGVWRCSLCPYNHLMVRECYVLAWKTAADPERRPSVADAGFTPTWGSN